MCHAYVYILQCMLKYELSLAKQNRENKHTAKLHDNQSASTRRADSGRTRMCTEENAIRVLRVRCALLRSVATLSSHEADARACFRRTRNTRRTPRITASHNIRLDFGLARSTETFENYIQSIASRVFFWSDLFIVLRCFCVCRKCAYLHARVKKHYKFGTAM